MSYRIAVGASAIAGALVCGACSKGDAPPAKSLAAPQPPTASSAPAPAPSSSAEIDAALKERLARQEAAMKLFDQPAPPPRTASAPGPAAAPAPAMPTAPSPPQEVRRVEPQAAPRAAEAPKAAPAPPAPARPAEPARAEAPAPRVDLAAAKPAALPEPAPRVLERVEPGFPRGAPDQGVVRARLTLDAAGGVTRVEIVEAQPRRVFDRAVVSALSQWKFSAGAEGRTFDTEVVFRR